MHVVFPTHSYFSKQGDASDKTKDIKLYIVIVYHDDFHI